MSPQQFYARAKLKGTVAGGPVLIVDVPSSPTFALKHALAFGIWDIFSLGEDSMSYFLISLHSFIHSTHLFNTSYGHGTGMGVGGEGQGIIGPCGAEADNVDKTQHCGRVQCTLSL